MVAKVAGGILGLGLIGTGGVAFVKPEWLGINKEIPWTPLSADHDFETRKGDDYKEEKFGGKYKNYLIGVVGNQKDKHLNREMWKKLFKRWEDKKPGSGKFSSTAIKDAYSESTQNGNQKALNRVCEDAYKTEITGFGTDGDKFKKDDVWKYCSLGTLVTLTNESHGDDKIGSESSNKAILVSVQDNSNNWFWEQRNKDFWSTETSNEWSGSKAKDDTNKSIFKTEYDSNKDNNRMKERQTIKQLCGQAYGLPKGSQSNNNNTDAQKFCKLETN